MWVGGPDSHEVKDCLDCWLDVTWETSSAGVTAMHDGVLLDGDDGGDGDDEAAAAADDDDDDAAGGGRGDVQWWVSMDNHTYRLIDEQTYCPRTLVFRCKKGPQLWVGLCSIQLTIEILAINPSVSLAMLSFGACAFDNIG